MSPSNQTLDFYDDNATDYAAEASGKIQREQVLQFARKLKPGARVLDLGSGGGYDALSLIKLGIDVTLLDGSAGLAKEAEERTGRPVRVLRFEELDFKEAFDGIWAAASLHHVHTQALPDVMNRVSCALVPSGLIFASFKEAEADWHDHLGRYYAAMSSDRLESLASEVGLVVEAIERSEGFGYDGKATMWLAMMARKKAETIA